MSNYRESIGQKTKESVILALRHYFQVISDFGTPGSTIKMPFIREAYGNSVRNYPAVFVKITSCRTQTLGIGKGFVQDVWSDDQQVFQEVLPGTENFSKPVPYKNRVIAERFGYLADVTFNLQVWGDNTYIRNRMVDELLAAFERYEKQSLMDQGIIIVSANQGEESDFPLNETTHIYVANITLTVNAELYFDYAVPSITGIQVKAKPTATPNPDQPPYIVGNSLADTDNPG